MLVSFWDSDSYIEGIVSKKTNSDNFHFIVFPYQNDILAENSSTLLLLGLKNSFSMKSALLSLLIFFPFSKKHFFFSLKCFSC